MAGELTNQIMHERLLIGLEMADSIIKEKGLKLTDYERFDIGVRIGQSLFIEKNKSYRASQIPR